MRVVRVARMTTTWTKAEHRDPACPEPIFRDGDQMLSRVQAAGGVVTLPPEAQSLAGDVLLAEEDRETGTRLHAWSFAPPGVERPWALFGLRLADGDALELWLRDGRGLFYGTPRRAEYRIAILRPGEVTRVIHNARNDFAASSRRERTYRWSDFVIEPLGVPRALRYGGVALARPLPLDRAKTVDLREDLL